MYQKLKDVIEGRDNFYIKKGEIKGYQYEIFYYHFSDFDSFKVSPLLKFCRGTTFITKEDGSRLMIPHLPKFFNLGEQLTYDELKNEKISVVSDKMDGSCIICGLLPNGEIFAKTIGSFESDQANMAQALIDRSPKYQEMIRESIKKDRFPIFEYISPMNQIVIDYEKEDLVLVQFVSQAFDIYSPKETDYIHEDSISVSPVLETPLLSNLVKEMETLKGKEGYVVQFFNGGMVKIKAADYLRKHRIMAPNQLQPKNVIEMIFSNELDDIFSELSEYKQDVVREIKSKVNSFLSKGIQDFKRLEFSAKEKTRKEFAISFNQHYLFPVIMKSFQESVSDEMIHERLKTYILTKIRTKTLTQDFLDSM